MLCVFSADEFKALQLLLTELIGRSMRQIRDVDCLSRLELNLSTVGNRTVIHTLCRNAVEAWMIG